MNIQEFFTTHYNALEFKKKYLPGMNQQAFYNKLNGFNHKTKRPVFFNPNEVELIAKGFKDLNFKSKDFINSIPTVASVEYKFTNESTGEKLMFKSILEACKALNIKSRNSIYQQLKNKGLVKGYRVSKVQKSK